MGDQIDPSALRILVRLDESGMGFDSRYLHLRGHVGWMEGRELRYGGSYGPGREFEKLGYTAQLDGDTRRQGGGFYARTVGYHDRDRLDLDQVEVMVKQLRRMRRHTDKIDKQLGKAADAVGDLARMALALGCTSDHPFLRRCDADADFEGTGFRSMDVDSLAYWVDHEVGRWAEKHGYTRQPAMVAS